MILEGRVSGSVRFARASSLRTHRSLPPSAHVALYRVFRPAQIPPSIRKARQGRPRRLDKRPRRAREATPFYPTSRTRPFAPCVMFLTPLCAGLPQPHAQSPPRMRKTPTSCLWMTFDDEDGEPSRKLAPRRTQA
jgi:hypothetical protein